MFRRLIASLIYVLVRLLAWTYKIEAVGLENCRAAQELSPSGAYILAFWHEHILTTVISQSDVSYRALVSDSWDGRVIARSLRGFGYKPVYGSQIRNGIDKGGLRALMSLIRYAKSGEPIAVAVDGSIGPRREVKSGIIQVASKAEVPIVSHAAYAKSFWALKTWDRFKIPKPFSKVVVSYGKPLSVSRPISRAEMPSLQRQVQSEIDAQERQAKRAILAAKPHSKDLKAF